MTFFAVRMGYTMPERVRHFAINRGYINKVAEVECTVCARTGYSLYTSYTSSAETGDISRYLEWFDRELEASCGKHPDYFETPDLQNADLIAA